MLRYGLLLSLITLTSAWCPRMCTPVPNDGSDRQISKELRPTMIPIVYEPSLRLTSMQASEMKKLVYEATFEDDRIIIRPKRRKLKRSVMRKIYDALCELRNYTR